MLSFLDIWPSLGGLGRVSLREKIRDPYRQIFQNIFTKEEFLEVFLLLRGWERRRRVRAEGWSPDLVSAVSLSCLSFCGSASPSLCRGRGVWWRCVVGGVWVVLREA